MSQVEDQLSQIMEEDGQAPSQNASYPQENDISQYIDQAVNETFREKERQALEYDRRQQAAIQSKRRAREQESLNEYVQPVVASLTKEMENDKDFANLLEDVKGFPQEIIHYLAEQGDPEDASLVIREIASNDQILRNLRNADTPSAQRRILSKVLKSIYSGAAGPKIPEMMRHNVQSFNANTSTSRSDYDQIAEKTARKYGF
jgi:hypothetical protein